MKNIHTISCVVTFCFICICFGARGGILPSSEQADRYDIVFDNEPLETVVKEFAKLPEVSMIWRPDDLNAKVTVKLNGVEWEPALKAILRMFDLMIIETVPESSSNKNAREDGVGVVLTRWP